MSPGKGLVPADGIEYVIEPIGELDGRYIEVSALVGWLDPSDEVEMEGVICHAYRGNSEVGKLALDGNDKVQQPAPQDSLRCS